MALPFSMGDGEDIVRSSVTIKRVQPSGKIEHRLEMVAGDSKENVDQLAQDAYDVFTEQDQRLRQYAEEVAQ